jgi:hypothetical protein
MPSVEWDRLLYAPGDEVTLKLWVVNDLQTPFPGASLKWSLGRDGTAVESGETPVDVAADSAARVATLRRSDLPAGHYELAVRLETRDGKPLGRNEHTFAIAAAAAGKSDAH